MFDFVSLFADFIQIEIVQYWIFAPAFLGILLLTKRLVTDYV